MENMTPLYGPEDIRALERKVKTSRLLCWLLGLGALAACVSCCALTNSGNAEKMELACIVTWTLAGWIVLYLRRFVTVETKHELQHAAMLNAGEPETLRGRVTVTKERLRIIHSIRITIVQLENAEGAHRLKVCRSREKKLKAAGDELTLYLVNGYIAGYSV